MYVWTRPKTPLKNAIEDYAPDGVCPRTCQRSASHHLITPVDCIIDPMSKLLHRQRGPLSPTAVADEPPVGPPKSRCALKVCRCTLLFKGILNDQRCERESANRWCRSGFSHLSL